jgi:GntR family transcriptional regulator
MSTFSTQSHLPIYFQIQQDILNQIKSGKLLPGAQLPSETELAQECQVSRITAKRALDELVHLGYAYRQQGKGTFVAQARIRDISGFRSFSEDMRARGFKPGSEILEFKVIEPDDTICQKLHISKDQPVFLLKRRRLADNVPLAFETAYLPCSLCPNLLNEDLAGGSLYSILKEKYRVVPVWADAEIEAAVATKEQASILGISTDSPVLIAYRITFSADYQAIETVESVYRGDQFTFYTGRQFIG